MITHWLLNRSWVPAAIRRIGWYLLLIAAYFYINAFPGGFDPFSPLEWLLQRGWLFLGLALPVAVAFIVVDRLEWQGTIELPAETGTGWTRSLRTRLVALAIGLFMPVFCLALFDFAQRAWFAGDLARAVVAGVFCLDLLLMSLALLVMTVSRQRVLAIEPEGVRFRDAFVPFNAVERVRVTGDLRSREVALIRDGQAYSVNLEIVGVSARTFVEKLVAVAPNLRVDWPNRGAGVA